jgi:galactose mutarotase-like enzyme
MIEISNNQIKASFLTKGAELKSLLNTKTRKEWMWNADPAFWSKSSPILFPIVGGLKDNTYSYGENNYQLPRHGFARDMVFDVRKQKKMDVVFGLASSKMTHELFPFDFDLEVEYSLEGNRLKTKYRVKNPSVDNNLWFSLGAHPAFAIEVNKEKSFNDYQLLFDDDDLLHLHPLRDNLLLKSTNDLVLAKKSLPLSYSLFENDALVTTSMKSKQLTLSNNRDTERLVFRFSNFPYFGIWSAKNANFVCLEPWAGIADFEDHDGNLTQKFGIVKLAPNETWTAEWIAEIY